MTQPTRRSTRTRKTPQRFSDENFETPKKTSDMPVNYDVDGQEYFDEYDGQGRLWEVNLLTNEKVLLYDPLQFTEEITHSGEKETKQPDTTVTKHTLIFKLRSKQLARRLYQAPFQITENHTLVCPWEQSSGGKHTNLMESLDKSIIYYLNKAINYYKEEVSGTDKFEQFKNKNLFVLDEITISESYFTPEGKECGEDRMLYPEWGRKHKLTLYGALMFDGATFHFYSDRVETEGPQLVITEKEKPRDKRVTFNLPPKKRKYLGEKTVFKKAVDTPETDIVVAETLLTMGARKKKTEKKTNKRLKKQKKKLEKKLDRLENLLEAYKTDNSKLTNSLDKLVSKDPATQYIFRQTYQKFSSLENRPIGIEYELYTNKLKSPLVTIAELITHHPEFHFSDSTQEEYIVFSYTHLPSGKTYDTTLFTKNKKEDCFGIILYNNQIDYDIDNFRKQMWWQFGSTLNYTIQIKQNIEKAIDRAVRRSRDRSNRIDD